jgi:phage terminase small subunit
MPAKARKLLTHSPSPRACCNRAAGPQRERQDTLSENATDLTPKQSRAIQALVTSGDIAKAAKLAGVARSTLYRWLNEPLFKSTLNNATRDALDDLSRRMVALGTKAADTLEEALEYDIKAPGTRVTAAARIIAAIPQLRELANLEDRVTELEKQANVKPK